MINQAAELRAKEESARSVGEERGGGKAAGQRSIQQRQQEGETLLPLSYRSLVAITFRLSFFSPTVPVWNLGGGIVL
jgi:hypothetical protein